MKRPAYQWNVIDARGDEVFMVMTYEQRGVYRELLDHQWLEGSIPSEPEQIARLLHLTPTRFAKLWPLISGKFRAKNNRLVNERLEVYRRELDDFVSIQAKNGAKGAAKRWGRHSGAIATPMANDSSSTKTRTSTVATEQQRGGSAEKAPSVTHEFLKWFQGEYKARRNGATYFVRWEAHGAIVKRLLTAFTMDHLKKLATILLTTNEEWTTGTDRGIEVLSAKVNWLEDKLCEWEAKKHARATV